MEALAAACSTGGVQKGLHEIEVENYRSLHEVKLAELGRLNVLVGPNASGKSTVIDVIQFLGDSVREDLIPAINKRDGFDRLAFRGSPKPGRIKIGIKAQVTRFSSPTALDAYELAFWRPAKGAIAREETFWFKRTRGAGRRIKIQGGEVTWAEEDNRRKPKQLELLREESLGLATLPRLSPEHGGEQVSQIAELFSSFRVFEISVEAARRPSAVEQRAFLKPDASNLSAFLVRLKDDEEAFAQLQRDARAMVPGLEEIQFREVGGAEEAVVIELVERGLRGRTPLADASYGTVRALALLALLYDPEPPLLTCVEEIDHGLHPHVFDLLVERLRDAAQRTQFLIATHSPALVNRLHPSELIVCQRNPATGEAQIPAIDSKEVAAMEQSSGLGLGELWFSGTLGGVP